MKYFPVTAVILSALLLTACGPRDIDAEPTDTLQMPVETERTVPVTVLSEPVSDFSEPVTETLPPADYGELLDTLSIDWIKADISLYFSGTSEGDSYSGTLTLVSVSQNGTEHSCKIFDNEAFALTPPEHSENIGYFSEKGFLYAESSEVISFSRIDGGRKYLRLFELEKDKSLVPISVIPDDDYSDIITGEYEFASEKFNFNANAAVNYDDPITYSGDINDYAFACFDYGENNYYEWLVDLKTDTAYIAGSLDFHRDDEVTEAVRELWDIYLFGNGYELDFGSAYGQYLEPLSGDETDEISYYRVSPKLASNREELMDFVREPFTDECADSLYLTEEELFEGSDPIFTEDSEGLVYINSYRGVPTHIDYDGYDTVRVTASDADTVDAIAYGSSVDGLYPIRFEFITQDGRLTASRVKTSAYDYMGTFFSSRFADGAISTEELLNPFDVKSWESYEVEISALSANFIKSDSGDGIICRLERAEDFSGTDLSPFYTSESTEVFPYYHTEKFTLTPEESGKYIFWAGARYISEDGEVRDVILGPQTVHVR
ncbi:hypothetical protein [Huintestinicola sp.]